MVVLKVLLFVVFPLACYALALRRGSPAESGPVTLRGRIRARGWGLLLPILGLMFAGLSTWNHVLLVAEVVSTCLIMVYAPRLASKLVPFLLFLLGVVSTVEQIQFGVVLAGANSWRTNFVLPETACFFAVGCWLFFRVRAPGAALAERAAARWWRSRAAGMRRGQEFLLLLVLLLVVSLLGMFNWFGIPGWTGAEAVLVDLLGAAGAVLLILRSRLCAATLAAAGLLVLGAYGFLLALYSPSLPGEWYGLAQLDGSGSTHREGGQQARRRYLRQAGPRPLRPSAALRGQPPGTRRPRLPRGVTMVPMIDELLLKEAEAATGFMPPAEGTALAETAARYAAVGPVLEIGTYQGKSTIYLAAGARPQLTITVDHHRGSEEHQPGWEYHDPSLIDDATGRIDTLPRLRETLHKAGLEDDVIVIVARSQLFASAWNQPVGLLFLDGGHTEEQAKADYESWAPHVARHGAIAIHDVFPDPADGGQAPYHVYLRALEDGFVEKRQEGSLRILERP
jgi:MMP 1-O-methyltransferase